MPDLNRAPARLVFDLLYCLVLDETRERVERRAELDAQLDSVAATLGPAGASLRPQADRSDRDRRAAQWGTTPAQQKAMRNAMNAGGAQANVAGQRARRGKG